MEINILIEDFKRHQIRQATVRIALYQKEN